MVPRFASTSRRATVYLNRIPIGISVFVKDRQCVYCEEETEFLINLIAKYRLYTTIEYQLWFYNWLIRLHVSAILSDHHQAYTIIMSIKVHSVTLPM